ncbi:hypothetical protein SAMN05444162_1891 [Paenibacillaceae bacterium GAS479]|nr:hypothetical protein SAMN05444162_1891 [Paenibacillaceae bacterium GAS479]
MKESSLKSQLKEPPSFQQRGFRPELMQQIKLQALQDEGSERPSKKRLAIYNGVAAFAVALCLFVLSFWSTGWIGEKEKETAAPVVAERTIYERDGKVILEVYPQPELVAGQYAGFIFSFKEPLSTFKDKTLTIQAVHAETGATELLSAKVIIGTPSSGYEGLERYTMGIVLPFGGPWRLEVTLDDSFYADAVVHFAEPDWKESGRYKSGSIDWIGEEGGVAIVEVPFPAGHPQKVTWRFWRLPFDNKESSLEIQAIRQEGGERLTLFSSKVEGIQQPFSALNGEGRKAVTAIELPERGLWRLLPYVDGKLQEALVVKAQ